MSFNRNGKNRLPVVVLEISLVLNTGAQIKCTRNGQFSSPPSGLIYKILKYDEKFTLKRKSEKTKTKKKDRSKGVKHRNLVVS